MWDTVVSTPCCYEYFIDDEDDQVNDDDDGRTNVPKKQQHPSNLLIRVFTGGSASIQVGPFTSALSLFIKTFNEQQQEALNDSPKRIVAEYMGVNEVCKQRWTASSLIDWLLHSDVHFILAHVHQGISSHGMEWNMHETKVQLMRLKYHTGFPCGEQLACPVFTQDKIEYLKCLGDFANETLTAPLCQDGMYDIEFINCLRRYYIVLLLPFKHVFAFVV